MGRLTQYRFDPFGNKSAKIDSGGARSEWNAATADYVVGRIETYRPPADTGQTFGQSIHNDFGEGKTNTFGNTRPEYDRHKNGLVTRVPIRRDVTQTKHTEMATVQTRTNVGGGKRG